MVNSTFSKRSYSEDRALGQSVKKLSRKISVRDSPSLEVINHVILYLGCFKSTFLQDYDSRHKELSRRSESSSERQRTSYPSSSSTSFFGASKMPRSSPQASSQFEVNKLFFLCVVGVKSYISSGLRLSIQGTFETIRVKF